MEPIEAPPTSWRWRTDALLGVGLIAVQDPVPGEPAPDDRTTPKDDDRGAQAPRLHSGESATDEDLPEEAPLPGEATSAGTILMPLPGPLVPGPGDAGSAGSSTVEVPVLGRLDWQRLGMPVFTVLIGLVDGFNPCAMWVLIFLLSVLVGLHDRRKMVLIAGTFVLISGLAYFAFMAAWLNVFLLIGLARPAQIALGVLAVLVGLVHVKDFFAFKKGVSLSIPESAKPRIYDRVRRIVAAKNVWIALAGAIVLAVLVNTIELLCTAGLPALYTNILTHQGYPSWKNYAYLGLYNLAYMFDDTLMLVIVCATLSRRRLQENEGRWLKLVSGVVILALGVVMLARPDWLV